MPQTVDNRVQGSGQQERKQKRFTVHVLLQAKRVSGRPAEQYAKRKREATAGQETRRDYEAKTREEERLMSGNSRGFESRR
ncbi:unnamed protein product [Sphagnum balticum]